MRFQSLVFFAIASSSLAAASSALADTAPADTVCPRAVPKLVAFNDAAASKDVAKITAAARSAADAYTLCASEAAVAKGVAVEPTVNYDKTRAAQYLVVLGRALAASGNATEAGVALKNARQFADDVFGWQPDAQKWHASQTTGGVGHGELPPGTGGNSAARNSDRDGSRYKGTARQIRAAADEALEGLGARRQPMSPAPEASPNHA
jgi:hypothetical protein